MNLILPGDGDKGKVAVASDYLPEGGTLANRIAKYERAKLRSLKMLEFIEGELRKCSPVGDPRAATLRKQAGLLRSCGTWLHFAYYFGWHEEGFKNETRLIRANFCKQQMLCNFCAVSRSIRALAVYLKRYRYIMAQKPYLMPFMITLTVKNGPDLRERFEHIQKSFRRLQDNRRLYLSSPHKRKFTQLAKVKAGADAYENTYNARTGEHHVHIHLVALCDSIPAHKPLCDEWEAITGDSFITDIRPFEDINNPETAFMEVFKYVLKFSTMPLDVNYQAAQVLARKRLLISFGYFWGTKVPQELAEDALEMEHVDYYFDWLDDHYRLLEVVEAA